MYAKVFGPSVCSKYRPKQIGNHVHQWTMHLHILQNKSDLQVFITDFFVG